MLKQRVKVVPCNVYEHLPILTGCHSNVSRATTKHVSFVIPIHVSTNAERLMKISRVVADEWTTIVKLKPSCSTISIC